MNQKNVSNRSTSDEVFDLWRFLDHTRYVISRSRERELVQYGLTPEQSFVLKILTDCGGSTTIGYIVNRTLRQHHTISTLVDRMTKRGLVEKKPFENDKRKYQIVMTDKGKTLFQKVPRKSIEIVFSTLAKGEKQQLSCLLRRLMSKAYELEGRQLDSQKEHIPCSTE